MIIGKSFTFDAAHFLPNHPKCGKMHGHTWTVEVEIEGPVNNVTGMVYDLHKLSEKVNSVLEQFDHTLLNNIFSIPTCESIASSIKAELIGLNLFSSREKALESIFVKVQEGKGGWARV